MVRRATWPKRAGAAHSIVTATTRPNSDRPTGRKPGRASCKLLGSVCAAIRRGQPSASGDPTQNPNPFFPASHPAAARTANFAPTSAPFGMVVPTDIRKRLANARRGACSRRCLCLSAYRHFRLPAAAPYKPDPPQLAANPSPRLARKHAHSARSMLAWSDGTPPGPCKPRSLGSKTARDVFSPRSPRRNPHGQK